MSYLFIYFLLMLDKIVMLFILGGTLSIIYALFSFGSWADNENTKEENESYAKHMKRSVIYLTMFVVFATITPSTKDSIIIWLGPKLINNEHIQEIPDKALELLNEKIDIKLEEIKE